MPCCRKAFHIAVKGLEDDTFVPFSNPAAPNGWKKDSPVIWTRSLSPLAYRFLSIIDGQFPLEQQLPKLIMVIPQTQPKPNAQQQTPYTRHYPTLSLLSPYRLYIIPLPLATPNELLTNSYQSLTYYVQSSHLSTASCVDPDIHRV
jgi:hypothetical protein